MSRMEDMKPVPILYEDNHLLVVVKPVNTASQGDASGDADMLTILKEDLKQRYSKPGNVYLGLVHRLDRPAGGVMIFAKTSKAASRLSEQIRQRSFEKIYLAVVHGDMKNSNGTLRHFLVKDSSRNIVQTAAHTDEDAKEAILDYKKLGVRDGFSLVRVDRKSVV